MASSVGTATATTVTSIPVKSSVQPVIGTHRTPLWIRCGVAKATVESARNVTVSLKRKKLEVEPHKRNVKVIKPHVDVCLRSPVV